MSGSARVLLRTNASRDAGSGDAWQRNAWSMAYAPCDGIMVVAAFCEPPAPAEQLTFGERIVSRWPLVDRQWH